MGGSVFVLPYVARRPDFAFVVETDDKRVVGYIVGAPDTSASEDWFHDEWWPRFAVRWPRPQAVVSHQDGILQYAYGRSSDAAPHGELYPAHLHIDLLPELRGHGWGRRLTEALTARLHSAAVPGRGAGVRDGALTDIVATRRDASAPAFERSPSARHAPGRRDFAALLYTVPSELTDLLSALLTSTAPGP
ncbi:MAG: hypothetical protein LKI58_06530 [Actinomyces sp.]|jgi:GNAT superfamily N-acetyltransferase|nr:hypothetical protein [Actinomyces sp.]MCI1641891.1 hypothetical protein [Actinomyces sp.]MCI1661904.1 hypothetical protein [Actinomyces sp.]MCI1691264.1 hypothetical protein [Actinomyces sp.]MCI1787707.1 hypothetical protein [Actinomyces sp.]MCI1830386.1 hypothetical protein [Actinomyces sp.]